MKQRDLLKALGEIAKEAGVEFAFVRHGGNHDRYTLGGIVVTIPRHNEVNERLAAAILKQASKAVKGER